MEYRKIIIENEENPGSENSIVVGTGMLNLETARIKERPPLYELPSVSYF